MKKYEHVIKDVIPGSIAEELEIEPGDILLKINNEIIEDIFDYQFYCEDEFLVVTICNKNGEEWDYEIEKDEDEDLPLLLPCGFL